MTRQDSRPAGGPARPMDLDVFALPGHLRLEAAFGLLRGAPVCIVLDVVRATSAIVLLFERGAVQVHVGRDLAAGRRLAAAAPGRYLDCGEDDFGRQAPGFCWPTSPTALATAPVAGREVVFCTANGTGCIHAAVAAGARAVLLGGFRNAAAVARRAAELALAGDAPVVLVGSGRFGNRTPALEDLYCAGYLARLVREHLAAARGELVLSDSVRVAEALYRAYPSRLAAFYDSGSGQGLLRAGAPPRDLELCAELDTSGVVPEVVLDGGRPPHPVRLIPEAEPPGDPAARPAQAAGEAQ
ncbi:MAG TPA: 2-phosphosulfolactate phosphatase, partial [Thermodesulfobacteriota bacterium]|nr:2-phosphosulfolactate phosphatase [Thermodesulfobacteriota bacterium]